MSRRLTFLAVLLALMSSRSMAVEASHSTVLMFLDRSGSMRQTDPNCMRWKAVDLLLELLQNEDRAALFEFGSTVENISGSLIELNASTRSRIRSLPGRCNARNAWTDILAALRTAERAVADLGTAAREAYPPVVVFLTDGVDDVPDPEPDRENQIIDALDSLGKMGARVFAVGLSGMADRDLLNEMKARTGGEVVMLDHPRDLLGSFMGIARELGSRWLLWEGQVRGGTTEIPIPQWVEAITAVYIPDAPGATGRLKAGGSEAEVVTPDFQVLKIPARHLSRLSMKCPGGQGKLIVEGAGDLVLATSVPGRIPGDVPFQMTARIMAGRGEELAPAAFLSRTAARVTWRDEAGLESETFLYDDGMHEDGDANDGVFGGRVVVNINGQASYEITVKAPYSRALHVEGVTQVMENAVTVDGPGSLAPLLTSLGRPVQWKITNRTDVPLHARVEFSQDGEIEQARDIIIPSDESIVIKKKVRPNPVEFRTVRMVLFLENQASPVQEEELVVWPRALLPLCLVALIVILLLSMIFPRRSARGAQISVYYYREDEQDPEGSASKVLLDNGPVVIDGVPSPLDSPGEFHARNGVWRKGIVYVPAPGILPRFKGRKPRRSGRGWVITRPVSWSVQVEGARADYSFRNPR